MSLETKLANNELIIWEADTTIVDWYIEDAKQNTLTLINQDEQFNKVLGQINEGWMLWKWVIALVENAEIINTVTKESQEASGKLNQTVSRHLRGLESLMESEKWKNDLVQKWKDELTHLFDVFSRFKYIWGFFNKARTEISWINRDTMQELSEEWLKRLVEEIEEFWKKIPEEYENIRNSINMFEEFIQKINYNIEQLNEINQDKLNQEERIRLKQIIKELEKQNIILWVQLTNLKNSKNTYKTSIFIQREELWKVITNLTFAIISNQVNKTSQLSVSNTGNLRKITELALILTWKDSNKSLEDLLELLSEETISKETIKIILEQQEEARKISANIEELKNKRIGWWNPEIDWLYKALKAN